MASEIEKGGLSRNVITLFFILGLTVACLVEWCHFREGLLIRELNYFLYDTNLKKLNSVPISEKVVIVDIDEKSLEQMGQWPWPRYRLGRLINDIQNMHPAAIGLDILMPEPDRTSPRFIQERYKRDFGEEIQISGVPDTLLDNDEYLGEVIRNSATVSAHYFLFDHSTQEKSCSILTPEVAGAISELDLFDAPGMLCNTEKLEKSDRFGGFINVLNDEDGVLRKLPALISHHGTVYPNLAIGVVMEALDIDHVKVQRDFQGFTLRLGEYAIPIEPDGSFLLRYPGPAWLYPYISASDLIEGNIEPRRISGKIVLIGSSAAGLYDFHHTIHDPHYPGVETLAVAAGNILQRAFIRVPLWAKKASLLLSLVAALGMTVLFICVTGPLQAIVGIFLFNLLLLSGGTAAFYFEKIFIPMAAPLVTAWALFSLFSVLRYGIEQRTSFIWYQKMARSQQVTLESMATVVETRDYETGGHIKRTQYFVRIIADQLVKMGLHTTTLTPEYIHLLYISAPLHDIGKVGVPDQILLKPGPLNFEEFEEMKKHTDYGRNILLNSGRRLGGDNFLELAREIAESHHEKWDGTGYPLGLAGDDIPLSGRIMMMADVYDALTSVRCYKPAYSHEKAHEILQEGRGSFFDPQILDAFLAREEDVLAICRMIRDHDQGGK